MFNAALNTQKFAKLLKTTKRFYGDLGIEKRLDALEQERGTMVRILTDVNSNLNQIKEKLSEHDVKFEKIDDKLSNQDVRLIKIDEKLSEQDVKIKKIDEKLSEQDVKIKKIDDRLSNQDARLSNQDARLIKIDQKLSEQVVQIEKISGKLNSHSQRLNEISAGLGVSLENLAGKWLKELLEEQGFEGFYIHSRHYFNRFYSKDHPLYKYEVDHIVFDPLTITEVTSFVNQSEVPKVQKFAELKADLEANYPGKKVKAYLITYGIDPRIKKNVDKLLDDNSIILIDAESRIIAAEERSSKDRH